MSNQLTPFEAAKQPETLQSLLRQDSYRKRFEQMLGERAGQFIGSIVSVGNTMHDVEPRSILASAAIAASLNLPIDKNLGFAWIIPYRKGDRKLAQFQMGYKGYIQLALRTAQYERMNAKAINAEALNGFDNVGEPIIDWSKLDETKPVVGYVFAFRLVNGFTKTALWSKAKVEAHAKRYSQSFRSGYDSPWKTDFDPMALKTVIGNELRHWGIMSVEMQTAAVEDQGVHIDVDTDVLYPENIDDITGPKFDNPGETKELAAAGLAPAEHPAQTQPEKVKKARRAPAAGATPIPGTSAGADGLQPPAPEQTADTPPPSIVSPVSGSLFSKPYNDLRHCMEQSGINDEELIRLCRHRGMMTEQQSELLQLSDATLTDMVASWTMVAGQIRQDRRRTQ